MPSATIFQRRKRTDLFSRNDGFAQLPLRRFIPGVLGLCMLAVTSFAAEPEKPGGFLNALNFRDLPVIPIPEIGTNPNSGTVVGILPVFLTTNEDREIRQIIAPDFIHDPNFGYGTHGRIFGYPSNDTQWYMVGGFKERVERGFDVFYTTGLTRQDTWSLSAEAVYDRNGTSRFYGIGNASSVDDETTYVSDTALVEGRIGWNLNPVWQLAYTLRPRGVRIQSGVLSGVPSIQTVFPVVGRLGTASDFLNMLSVTYDTRDSLSIPTHGSEVVAYAGLSPPVGGLASYSVAGIDARNFWPIAPDLIIASHAALRYMPSDRNAPFWSLASLGGSRSVLAGAQPLRGFGEGRFVDRNSFSASVEIRYRVLDLQLFKTNLSVELAPFAEVGRVFHSLDENPFKSLHPVGGIGFRAFARPFIVGYVDVGYGSDGVAVFSGIKYPF